MSKTITLLVSPAQLRMINTALAREEAEDHDDDDSYKQPVMDRTRDIVQNAMVENQVAP